MIPKPALVTLAGILCLLLIVPAVNAQTASVTILRAPSQVQIGSDGTATFDVTAHVSFSAIPEGVYSGSAAHWDNLNVILGYYSNGNMPSSFGGSTTSTPDQCSSSSYTIGGPDLSTSCGITPNCQFTTTYPTCSGTEDVSFHVVISNAQPQQSHFEVYADIWLWNPSQIGYYNPTINIAYSDFHVSMVSAPVQQQFTTPTYAQYTSSTVQPTYQPEQTGGTGYYSLLDTYYSIFLLWLVAIAAVVIFGAWILQSRKRFGWFAKTKSDGKQASLTQFVKTPTSCIKCGAELPPASDFCNKCGTKQEGS